MQINETAPVVSSHQVIVRAPLEKVWRLLTDIDRWSNWNAAVSNAHLDGEFKTGATFRWKSGGMTIVSTLQQIEPMTRLVWTGRAIGTQVIHLWTFAESNEGVRVSTSESFEGLVTSSHAGDNATHSRPVPCCLASGIKKMRGKVKGIQPEDSFWPKAVN